HHFLAARCRACIRSAHQFPCCALSRLHSLRSSLPCCALSRLHSLRSSLPCCALSRLHSLRSSVSLLRAVALAFAPLIEVPREAQTHTARCRRPQVHIGGRRVRK